ncbi:hypothetical protein TcCL_ESM10088 [Trypanosoma cruzi]|nr:hypothetical protein TcCL_ESM10088 [Trypanosoma cruzi]
MSRDNSSQPLKYAARHSVNCPTVLAVVWCPPAVVICSPTSVLGFDSMKKKASTSGKFPTASVHSSRCFILVFVCYSIASNPLITRRGALQGSHPALLVASAP